MLMLMLCNSGWLQFSFFLLFCCYCSFLLDLALGAVKFGAEQRGFVFPEFLLLKASILSP